MFKAESYVGYKLCRPDDLVINSLWAWAGGLGVSGYHGIISSAYGVYRLRGPYCMHPNYIHRLVRSVPFNFELRVRSKGIWISRLQLTDEAFLGAPFPIPSIEEQAAIVRFLDHVDRRIWRYIRAKEKLIALLEEQKQAIIQQAVTGQIDVRTGGPYPSYKDSGVEWLGEVPEHWAIRRAKWLFQKMERPVEPRDEVITCFRDGVVTLRKNRRTGGFTESLKEIGYQGIRKDDLVIHAMDAFAGAIGVSDSDGKGTPVYSVCKPAQQANAYYYAYILREMSRNRWIEALAKGIRERSSDFRYSKFGSQVLPLPPHPEQTAIVHFLDHTIANMDAAVDQARRQIELLREYGTRLIADVVTGKLDVREAAAALPETDPLAEAEVDDPIDADGDSNLEESNAAKEATL